MAAISAYGLTRSVRNQRSRRLPALGLTDPPVAPGFKELMSFGPELVSVRDIS